MNTPAINPTPSQRQLWEAHKARQARLWTTKQRPANANVKTKPVVEVKPIKAKQIPLWQQTFVMFDAHVVAYRMWLVSEVNRLRCIAPEQEAFTPSRKIPAKVIIDDFLQAHPDFTIDDLKSSRRNRDLVDVRHMAMYVLRKRRPDLSFPQIGRFFGGFDHTSVLHAIGRVENSERLKARIAAAE